MPKITIKLDGVTVIEATLTKEQITLGRRPYNDIVLDNLTVSGEHALINLSGAQATIEDLHSTNGISLNGKSVKKENLRNGDILEIGKYRIEFETEQPAPAANKTEPVKSDAAVSANTTTTADFAGSIKVLTGPAAGREMTLTKVVTTIGKPGISVAAITQRHHNFFASHIEGSDRITINGEAVGDEPLVLHSGDLISLAGTEMKFLQK